MLEGVVLFVILLVLARRPEIRERPGQVGGAFLVGYGVFRSVVELFREPDAHIGFLAFGITMGQLLSLPMIILGLGLIVYARAHPPVVPARR